MVLKRAENSAAEFGLKEGLKTGLISKIQPVLIPNSARLNSNFS
jgi:hypothetical protein